MRTIMHIDCNSAYLAWTAVDRLQHGSSLDLRTIPSVIGGNEASRHGIVLTKSIPAKKYGILTGETLYNARKKCPNLVVVPPQYDVYMRCSRAMREILNRFSDKVQPFSIDECFLDYTNMEPLFGDPIDAANEIRRLCREDLGFTVNIGISTNKLLAKMAGELKKPDMTHTLYSHEIPTKLWPLPVEELFLVGPATAPKLYEMGIKTIGDLALANTDLLQYRFKKFGLVLKSYANGIEGTDVSNGGKGIKGIGNSTTIAFDVEDSATASKVILSLTESVSSRLRSSRFLAGGVAVSYRNSDFINRSHQCKLSIPTDNTMCIFKKCVELFESFWDKTPVRHIGIRLFDLKDAESRQLSFFEEGSARAVALDETIDKLRCRFGSGSLFRATMLHSGIKTISGGVGNDDDYTVMSSIL